MKIRVLFVIVTSVLLIIGLIVNNEKLQRVLFVLTAVGVFASLLPLDGNINPSHETSSASVPTTIQTETLPPVTPNPTPTPSTPSPSPLSKPQSPYGQAIQKEQLGQASYKDWEKANIVTETYYARKNDNGTAKSWYTSTHYNDENTGYRIGLYYADGLLFFAAAYHVGERDAVTFYFWNDQMFACHDINGGETGLSYQGSSTYNRIAEQFGDIYAKSLQYAQDAK